MPLITDPKDRKFDTPGWEAPRNPADAEFLRGLSREMISPKIFRDANGNIGIEGYMRLRAVLRSHRGPVERHEASFWLGEAQPPLAVTELIASLLRDRSPTVRHESTEALGRMQKPPDALMAHGALCRIFMDESYQAYEKPDVLSTIQIAIVELERRFPEFATYREEMSWPQTKANAA